MQSKEVRATQVSRDISALYEDIHRKHLRLITERDDKIRRREALQAEYRAAAARTSDQLVLDDMLRELESIDEEIVDIAFIVETHFVLLEKTIRDLSGQVKSMLHREWYKPILRMVSLRKVKKLRGATDTEDYNAVRDLALKICEKVNNFVSKNLQDASAAAEARARLAEIKEREHLEKISDIKGVQMKIEWGSQIRSYVFMPYQLVKDLRTEYETGNIQSVMDGDLDGFINAFLSMKAEN